MSEDLLESLARGACRLAAPGAVEAYDNLEEMNHYGNVMHQCMDPETTMTVVEATGEAADRLFRPLRRLRTFLGALKSRS